MTRDEIVSFFEARQEHWQRRDAAALAEGHAEDGTVVSPMFGSLNGRASIAQSYERLFEVFPDWSLTSEEPIIDGKRVAQHFVTNATHVGEFMGLPGTNRHGRVEGVLLYTMADGAIQLEHRLYDFSAFLIQIGVLRSKPSF
jgi:steroid delta-isomerase-like uncharacterized protein